MLSRVRKDLWCEQVSHLEELELHGIEPRIGSRIDDRECSRHVRTVIA
jgi:hypothetical protein